MTYFGRIGIIDSIKAERTVALVKKYWKIINSSFFYVFETNHKETPVVIENTIRLDNERFEKLYEEEDIEGDYESEMRED